MAKQENFSHSNNSNERENQIEYKELLSFLSAGDVSSAVEIKEKMNFGQDVLKSPEVLNAIYKGIETSTYTAQEIIKNFWIPKDKKEEIGYRIIIEILSENDGYDLTRKGRFDDESPVEAIYKVKEKFFISDQKFDDAVFEVINNFLTEGDFSKAEMFQEALHCSDEKLQNKEFIEKIRSIILDELKNGQYTFDTKKAIETFHFPESELHTPELTEVAYLGLLKSLRNGRLSFTQDVLNLYPNFNEKMSSSEFQEAMYAGLIEMLNGNSKNNHDGHDFISYLKYLGSEHFEVAVSSLKDKLKSKEVSNLALEKLIWFTENGWEEGIDSTKEFFQFSSEELNSSKMLDTAYKAILSELNQAGYRKALKIKESFSNLGDRLKSEEVEDSALRCFEYWINSDSEHMNMVLDTQKEFPISQEKLLPVVYKCFLKKFRNGDIKEAVLINKNFPLPEEYLRSEEIMDVISDDVSEKFSQGKLDEVLELVTQFKFPKEKQEEFTKEILTRLIADGRFFDELIEEREEGYYDEDDVYHQGESRMILRGGVSIESLISKFPNLKEYMTSPEMTEKAQDVFIEIALSNRAESLESIYSKFSIRPETIQKAFKEVSEKTKDFNTLNSLNNLLEKPIDPLLSKTSVIFGDFANVEHYKLLQAIKNGDLNTEVKNLGVKETGEAGIVQLEQGFAKFREKILDPNFDPNELLNSHIKSDYFKSQVRFDQAEWEGNKSGFQNMLQRYIAVFDQGEMELYPLNKQFTPSKVLQIGTIDSSKNSFAHSESFFNRFKVIKEDIAKAKNLYLSKFPITQIVNTLDTKIKDITNTLEQKMSSLGNEKAKEALSQRIEQIKSINLRNLSDFQKNFSILSTFKELDSDLRQAVFMMGFAKNRTQLEKNVEIINIEKPDINDITWTMNFVDHIVNKEVMLQYFTDKQSKNKFREIINIKSFEEELSRFQNQDKVGTLAMKFIPTRGILMEFSGHIADACWADKYTHTIPATFPNMSSVTMVQNPGTKHERICGSCILIETREAKRDGQPLLLVRGLNPIQNTINRLSVEDFYNQFTDYIKELGEKTGRKVAIVIDKNSGGSATNRPLLHNYLSSLDLKKVRVPYRETEFNSHDVTNSVYLVK